MATPDIASMRQAMQGANVKEDDLIAMGFALAKALEDQQRYTESMAALAHAHARARTRRPWRTTELTQRLDAIIEAFTPPTVAAPERLGEEVIFIASMPRAGSTLVEQILASHSQVNGVGRTAPTCRRSSPRNRGGASSCFRNGCLR